MRSGTATILIFIIRGSRGVKIFGLLILQKGFETSLNDTIIPEICVIAPAEGLHGSAQ